MPRRAPLIRSITLVAAMIASARAHGAPRDSGMASGYPCVPADRCYERVDRYRALGLPEARLREFVDSRRSVTDWYNREHLGGGGLTTAGWILLGVGLTSIALGVIAWHDPLRRRRGDEYDDVGALGLHIFFTLPALVAGSLEVAVGVPLLIAGTVRKSRWIRNDRLDRLPLDELECCYGISRCRAKPEVSVLPYLAPGGGGVSLSLRF